MSNYAVGIDLGTTNCGLAYVDLRDKAGGNRPKVHPFPVPQLLEASETGSLPLLPSFLYLPADHEVASLTAALKSLGWSPEDNEIVGEGARRLGSRVPGRLVASAKSWLCHPGVDRTAAILPWGVEASIPRISPVRASGLYLAHLRNAWNARFAQESPVNRLEKQHVVLTVPASFDEVARELTIQAAVEAGLEHVTLLEEPQAAFYHWLHASPDAMSPPLPVGSCAVVIDCGGGTTDFSLIAVVEREGRPEFERVAVGDHLLLGGDNMDLAIARHVEQVVSPHRRLDAASWGSLVLSCRQVKERALSVNPPDEQVVTVVGRGQRVVGGTLSCKLKHAEILRLTLDGFFPAVGFGEEPLRAARTGLQEYGLPYVADPAITRHLAYFLGQHREALLEASGGTSAHPSAILFNGGVFNAHATRRQILHVMQSWFGSAWEPRVLQCDDFDLAVAQGAAAFSWIRQVGARRIRSGAARSYYVGIAAQAPSPEGTSTDSEMVDMNVLCLVPHGLGEGESVKIDELPLELRVGEPVSFPLYTSTIRPHDRAGSYFSVTAGQLASLPALTTVLRGGRRGGKRSVEVRLEAKLTEIGTLELHCVSKDGQNRWRLQFQTRGSAEQGPLPTTTEQAPAAGVVLRDTWSEEELRGAAAAIEEVYSSASADAKSVQSLPKRLEESLELPRSRWPTSLLRALWDLLVEVAPKRGRSPDHEARWYNLAGYVLRPGFGDPMDSFRVEQLWKLVHQGVQNARSDNTWCEYWILFRRAAGGLDPARQLELGNRILPYLNTGATGRKPPRRAGDNERSEIWRTAASLEHLETRVKVALGQTLLKQARRDAIARHVFWAITRLGSRQPVYGPANLTVPTGECASWIRTLLETSPKDETLAAERDFAIVQLARRTGDRGRDIEEDLRTEVLKFLEQRGAKPHWIETVAEVTAMDEAEESRLLGDAAPPGLRLKSHTAGA